MYQACLKEKTYEYVRYLNARDNQALRSILCPDASVDALWQFIKEFRDTAQMVFKISVIDFMQNLEKTTIKYQMLIDEQAYEGMQNILWSGGDILSISLEHVKISSVDPERFPTLSDYNLHKFACTVDKEDEHDLQIVGWGTGAFYQHVKEYYLGRLTYLVDGNPDKWGKEIDGLEIYSPEKLKLEEKASLIVVVFSTFFNQIEEQLNSFGVTHYMPPVTPYEKRCLKFFLAQARYDVPCNETVTHEAVGIVFQGPVNRHLTPIMLKRCRYMHPGCRIVLSTWASTTKELLESVEPYVDELLLLNDIADPGHRNRNRQSFTTHEGLKALKRFKCQFALKMRTDLWTSKVDLLDYLLNVWNAYPISPDATVQGRLIVPESFTRLAFPLHPSDLLMFGQIDDMMKYWGSDHNNSQYPIEAGKSIWDFSLSGSPPESHYAINYFSKLNDTMPETFEEALNWFCNHFIVVDDEMLELTWYKKLNMGDSTSGPFKLFSHGIWQAIAFENKADIISRIYDPKSITVQSARDSIAEYTANDYSVEKQLQVGASKGKSGLV